MRANVDDSHEHGLVVACAEAITRDSKPTGGSSDGTDGLNVGVGAEVRAAVTVMPRKQRSLP
jgi:hypothetical protein